MKKTLSFLFLCQGVSCCAMAQVTLAINSGIGYPFFFKSRACFNQSSLNNHAGVSYLPDGSRLFPAMAVQYAFTDIPLTGPAGQSLRLVTDCADATLFLNVLLAGDREEYKEQLTAGAGIGIMQLLPGHYPVIDAAGNQLNVRLSRKRRVLLYPEIQTCLEYRRRISEKYNWFWLIRTTVTYLHFMQGKQLWMENGPQKWPVAFRGDAIWPALTGGIAYSFQRKP